MSTCPNGHIDNSAKFHKDNYVTPNLPILSKRANQNAIEIMGDSVRRVFNKKKKGYQLCIKTKESTLLQEKYMTH